MKPRLIVQLSVSVGVLVFALGVLLSGGKADTTWLDFYSYAVTAAVAAYWLWDRALWRWPLVQRLKMAPRDLSGTWQGTVTSLWSDPSSDEPLKPKRVYLVVRQTASSISAILLSDEAKSVSTLASVNSTDGTASLDYLYLGSPDLRHEGKSRMHHGSCSLAITGLMPTRLKGRYWTDRNSSGELEFASRLHSYAEDFDEAEALFKRVSKS